MGYLQDRHGVMIVGLGRVPEGTCPECAVKHDPKMPHNRDSLAYQYKFYDENGRWPTWMDAMAHCDEDMKQTWIKALREEGVVVEQEPATDYINIEVSVEDTEDA